jgi:acyl-CoA reductase-like NAD-dependent aldehyde dehydrogenase
MSTTCLCRRASEQAFIGHAQRILAQRYPDLLNGDYTAIIDQRQYERLQAMLADAMAQGAQAVPLMPGTPATQRGASWRPSRS